MKEFFGHMIAVILGAFVMTVAFKACVVEAQTEPDWKAIEIAMTTECNKQVPTNYPNASSKLIRQFCDCVVGSVLMMARHNPQIDPQLAINVSFERCNVLELIEIEQEAKRKAQEVHN